jgi:thioredoxin 1
MSFRVNIPWIRNRGRSAENVIILTVATFTLLFTGCDQFSGVLGIKGVNARTAEDGVDVFTTYQDALIGKDAEAVVKAFGKPKGIFEHRNTKIWMYSRWCVEFNAQDEVVRMERDVAATGSAPGAQTQSMAIAARPAAKPMLKTAAVGPSAPDGIVKVSRGGQSVDLNSLMPANKITVVDFYADWCGPCRSIAPQLEKLARENPEVVLVKVDIVKWGSPVTRQYAIKSVPNIRVFDRDRRPVGQPTSNLSKIQSYVRKAGG